MWTQLFLALTSILLVPCLGQVLQLRGKGRMRTREIQSGCWWNGGGLQVEARNTSPWWSRGKERRLPWAKRKKKFLIVQPPKMNRALRWSPLSCHVLHPRSLGPARKEDHWQVMRTEIWILVLQLTFVRITSEVRQCFLARCPSVAPATGRIHSLGWVSPVFFCKRLELCTMAPGRAWWWVWSSRGRPSQALSQGVLVLGHSA